MQLCLFHLDDALKQQEGFIRTCDSSATIHVEAKRLGQSVRLWAREPELEKFADVVMPQIRTRTRAPRLVFMGSSDFHHLGALLIANTLQHLSDHITVLDFTPRPSWRKLGDALHVNSWYNRVLDFPQVTRLISIGATAANLVRPEWKKANLAQFSYGGLELYPYDAASSRVGSEYGPNDSFSQHGGALHWKSIETMGEEAFATYILERIPTGSIYISIDKSVLAAEYAVTNNEPGALTLTALLTLLRRIAGRHRIVGAHISGDYAPVQFSGDEITRMMKHAEIYRRPSRTPSELQEAIATNSATNHALFALLSQSIRQPKAPGSMPNSIIPPKS